MEQGAIEAVLVNQDRGSDFPPGTIPSCALAQGVVAVYPSGNPPFALWLSMRAVTHRKASTGSW